MDDAQDRSMPQASNGKLVGLGRNREMTVSF
jgi:hypothetical protein